jgi:hypothetical protein
MAFPPKKFGLLQISLFFIQNLLFDRALAG